MNNQFKTEKLEKLLKKRETGIQTLISSINHGYIKYQMNY